MDGFFLLARLLPNGSLDASFGTGGKVRTSFGDLNGGANGAVLQPDGRIVAVGFQATNTIKWAQFALARYVSGSGSPSLASAVSRKVHGAAGAFDVALPLTGGPGVEPRNGNGRHTLVFAFSADVVSGHAAITAGTGSILGSPIFSGRTMTVDLTAVADVQKLTVMLSGVTTSTGQPVPDATVSVNMLVGDTTGDKAVKASDVTQTRAQVGIAVSSANFRQDVTADGSIVSTDVNQVRSRVGNSVP